MANHKSAEKRERQSLSRRGRNRSRLTRLRNATKQVRAAAEAGETEKAQGLLESTVSLIDRSAQVGVIHRNAAARQKSRLTKLVRGVGTDDS